MSIDSSASTPRMPVVFVPHGGGPWPFVDMGLDAREVASLSEYLQGLPAAVPAPPRALLVVSAHWEEPVPTVMTAERPAMLYDYYGFPKASYELKWPAPGQPQLANRVRQLLESAGFEAAQDSQRGYDHGAFIPMKVAYPAAEIPTIQLSILRSLDPSEHLELGRALAPLRDEAVFIVGSGMTYHNLRAFGSARAKVESEAFDAWLRASVVLPHHERDLRLRAWLQAPSARAVHPREEHLLPLMVIAGAAGEDRGSVAYQGTFMGAHLSAYHFG